jgi:opacity protein-like surface antigen
MRAARGVDLSTPAANGGFVKSFVRSLVAGSLLVGLAAVASPAAAQNLDFGYSFNHLSGGGDSLNMPAGFFGSYEWPLTGVPVSVVGFLDVGRKSESERIGSFEVENTLTLTKIGGAVRKNIQMRPMTFYGQVGVGVAILRDSSEFNGDEASHTDKDAFFTIGVGASHALNRKWGIVGSVNYSRIFTEDEGTNDLNISVGARLRFK